MQGDGGEALKGTLGKWQQWPLFLRNKGTKVSISKYQEKCNCREQGILKTKFLF